MAELRGLANLLASTGTLHGIEEPPEREDWRTEGEYEAAYAEWYSRTHYWRVVRSD